jgi:hypothetical protein
MKKIVILSMALFSLGFVSVSCSSDDNGGGIKSTDLLGRWEFARAGQLVNGQEVYEDYQHEIGCPKDFLQLNSDGTGRVDTFTADDEGNCEEDSMMLTAWSLNGNRFTSTSDGVTESSEIVSVTASSMKVKSVESDGTYFTTYTRPAN